MPLNKVDFTGAEHRHIECAGHAVNLRGAGATPSPKGAEMTGIL